MQEKQTHTEPVISLQEVSRFYAMGDVRVVALNAVSFDIFPGEFVSIMGEELLCCVFNLHPYFVPVSFGHLSSASHANFFFCTMRNSWSAAIPIIPIATIPAIMM